MRKPTEKMIAYASDIHLYSPNDFTDEVRADFELTRKYIEENKRFLKRKKLFAPTQKSTLALMFPTRIIVMWVFVIAWVLTMTFIALEDPKTDWVGTIMAIFLFFIGPAAFYNVVTYRLERLKVLNSISGVNDCQAQGYPGNPGMFYPGNPSMFYNGTNPTSRPGWTTRED
ncbi:MAG: hypothetical protein IBX55_24075 [Methyloprofundus sp.]|nr:hypothetical protein [Methyloprofundus sp.]